MSLVTATIGLAFCTSERSLRPPTSGTWDSGSQSESDTAEPESGGETHRDSYGSRVVGDTDFPFWREPLPLPSDGSHELVFPDHEGAVDYHVLVTLGSEALYDWLEDHADETLEVMDAVLLEHGLDALSEGGDFADIEADLLQALATLYGQIEGEDTEDVLDAQLHVDGISPG